MLTHDASEAFADLFIDAAQRRGLQSRRAWVQSPRLKPGSVEATVRLLFEPPDGKRPDALLLEDDNFVEDATHTLKDMTIHVPDQVGVVTHCNFPNIPPSAVPVTRMGFDAGELLLDCVGTLRRLRCGAKVTGVKTIPAVYERETERNQHPRAAVGKNT